MYLYKIAYGGYEEYDSIELSHERKLSKATLEEVITEATAKAIERWAKESDYYYQDDAGLGRWDWTNHTPSFADVHKYVGEVLVSDYGFQMVQYQGTFDCSSNSGLLVRNEAWTRSGVNDVYRKLRKRLLQKLEAGELKFTYPEVQDVK